MTQIKSIQHLKERGDGMNKNKNIRMATSLMLVASTVATVAPVQSDAATSKQSAFTDVKKGDYFHDAVVTLTNERVLNGYGDQTFRPNVPTTRGHIAIVLTRVLGLKASQYINIEDMPTTHNTYEYAAAAIEQGFMETDASNRFNPKNELSRYEYADILMRAYNLTPTYEKKHQFKNIPKKYELAVQTVFDHGLMRGVSTTDFGGYQKITRGQMAVTLINARTSGETGPAFTGDLTTDVISYNPTTKKIVTTDGEFKLNDSVLPLFTANNRTILQNAVITGKFVRNELVAVQHMELVNPGVAYANESFAQLKQNAVAVQNTLVAAPTNAAANTLASNVNRVLDLGGLTIQGTITLKRNSTTIRNGTVGQIIVTDEADRDVTLDGVKVKDVIVQYGYYRNFTLVLNNTEPNRLTIDRNNVHLVSNKKVPRVLMTDYASTLQLQAALGLLEVIKGGHASLYGQVSIDRLLVADDVEVYINSAGYIKAAEVLERGGQISLGRNVRIGTAIVPPVGAYEDYFSFAGNIKDVIAKVTVPGSDDNLFHDVIELPSREELQRQELFDKLVEKFEASDSKNELTLVSRLSSYTTGMRDYPVRLSFTVTSGLEHLSNDTVIPTTITFKGHKVTHHFRVENLRQGVLTVNAKGELLTLKDLSPNSDNRLYVEFDTPFPMTVRGNLVINGYSKGTAETVINREFAEGVAALINSMGATAIPGGAQIEKRYGTVGEQFDQLKEDMRLQITQVRKPQDDTKVLPFTITYVFDGTEYKKDISNVTIAQLKSGVSMYSLLDVNDKKILSANGNKIEKWTIQFNDTIDADFQATATVEGIVVKSTSFKANYAVGVKAIKTFATSVDTAVVQLSKTYDTIDSSLVDKVQDVKMKLTSSTTPSAQSTVVPFTIKYKLADGQEQSKDITNVKVSDLRNGVSLYTLLGLPEQKVIADLGGKIEAFTITFKESIRGNLAFEALVDGSVEQTTTTAINSQVVIPPTPTPPPVTPTPASTPFVATTSNDTATFTRTFTNFDTTLEGVAIDAKLFVSNVSKVTSADTVDIAIKHNNGTEQTIPVKVSDLMAGKSLPSLLSLSNYKLAANLKGTTETWAIRFLDAIGGEFFVKAYQDGQEIVTSVDTVTLDVGATAFNGLSHFATAVNHLDINDLFVTAYPAVRQFPTAWRLASGTTAMAKERVEARLELTSMDRNYVATTIAGPVGNDQAPLVI